MKKLSRTGSMLIIILCVFIQCEALYAQDSISAEKKIINWFETKEWLNGLVLQPHASINKAMFAKQYQSHKALWDKAFQFLKEQDLVNLTPGKYAIEGEEVFATINEGVPRDFDTSKWESHRVYADIHYVISGRENIGFSPVDSSTLIKEYNPVKDIMFYTAKGKLFVATPGVFFIFFPGEAHEPNIKIDGDKVVKKLVIKVRAGAP